MKALETVNKKETAPTYNRTKPVQDSVMHKHKTEPDFVGSGYYPPERFVPLLAKFSHPANVTRRIQIFNQLQRHYGNRYVQRIVAAFRSQNTEEEESKLASGIVPKKGSGSALETGNQAVQRLFNPGVIQAKLRIGQPNDIYEQEADRVADEVMRMPEPHIQRDCSNFFRHEFGHAKTIIPTSQSVTNVRRSIPHIQRYNSNVHFGLTRELALTLFTDSDATQIARSDQSVDEGWTHPYVTTPASFVPGNYSPHFKDKVTAVVDVQQAIATCSPSIFGRVLHSYQDSFSHSFPSGASYNLESNVRGRDYGGRFERSLIPTARLLQTQYPNTDSGQGAALRHVILGHYPDCYMERDEQRDRDRQMRSGTLRVIGNFYREIERTGERRYAMRGASAESPYTSTMYEETPQERDLRRLWELEEEIYQRQRPLNIGTINRKERTSINADVQKLQAGSSLESTINSLNGGGQPLSKKESSFFEPRFGSDLSSVRIHNDSNANKLARRLNAKAFTIGRNIVFGAGEYNPEILNGRRLLAHELSHVIQQSDESSLKSQSSLGRDREDRVEIKEVANNRVQRWTDIGAEVFFRSPEGAEGGSGEATWSMWESAAQRIMVGSEEEWRQRLDQYTTRGLERRFLRAIFVSDERFPEYAMEGQNSALMTPARFYHRPSWGSPVGAVTRNLSRRPTHGEKMAFARALILRRGRRYVWTYEQELLTRFIRAFQHRVLESEARAGRVFNREQAGLIIPDVLSGPGSTAAPSTQQATAIGIGVIASASTQLQNGIAQYIAAYERNTDAWAVARRIILSAGNVLRQITERIQQISDDERDNLESSIDVLIKAIPIPGATAFVDAAKKGFQEFVTPQIGSALASADEMSARIGTLRSGYISSIESRDDVFEEAGQSGETRERLRDALTALVQSVLQ